MRYIDSNKVTFCSPDQIPIAFISVKLDSKPTHVANWRQKKGVEPWPIEQEAPRLTGICAPTAPLHGREAHKHRRRPRRVGQNLGTGVLRKTVVVDFEVSMGTRTPRVHDSLRNTLVVEAMNLLTPNLVF